MNDLCHRDRRWALRSKMDGRWFLVGKYYWPDATDDEPRVRTFRTRLAARRAGEKLSIRTRAVPVRLSIEADE